MGVKRKVLLGFVIFLVVLTVHMMIIEPSYIEQRTIELEDTGTEMVIVFLADFQRRDADPAFVQRAVEMVNDINPDLVILGGDYVEGDSAELASIEPLKDIDARFGIYGVMGNHDYGAYGFARDVGGDMELAGDILEFFESDTDETPITILRNQKVVVDDRLTIVGLDELWAYMRDEKKASQGPDVGFRILLSHNQDELDITKEDADLYLFGHTHCGQIRLPGLGSVPKTIGFSGDYDMGYYLLDDGAHVYTTCGLTPGPRLLNPPEITVIQLEH